MNHLELTIADLRAARNRADMLINGLLEFQAGCDGMDGANRTNVTHETVIHPDAEQAVQEHCRSLRGQTLTARTEHLPDVPRGTHKQAAPHKNAPKGRAVAVKLFKVAQSLTEPFTPADLAAAARADRKQCENFIVHRVVNKMFTRGERGQYRRGPKFPITTVGIPVEPNKTHGTETTQAKPIKVRKLGERPGLVPMARGDARPTISATPTPAALASVSSMIDKPTTLGAAMKVFIRTLTEFTGEQLRQALQADKDFAKLIEESYSTFANNLMYWAKQGYLDKDGDAVLEAVFTVTTKGKEWFAK